MSPHAKCEAYGIPRWLWATYPGAEPIRDPRRHYDALIERHMKEIDMPLDKTFNSTPDVAGHDIKGRVRILTHGTDNNLLVVRAGKDVISVAPYSQSRDAAWLGIKDVAALHAILGNWLKKRDRRSGADRRVEVSCNGTAIAHGRHVKDNAWRAAAIPSSLERRKVEHDYTPGRTPGRRRAYGPTGRRKGDVR